MATNPGPVFPRITGYQIKEEVGRGGVATVYRAIQESLNREVALKIMSPALGAEPNFSERFVREGRTIALLSHPGIVTIYDISVEDYQHYIAMEYLGYGSLKQRMHQRISQGTALTILGQVALALGYAHKKNYVHRDVKPENIIFRDERTPVLTDFGIAKSTTSETQLTSLGVIVGTPRYMSPEQASGHGTDPRSDIYALGIILYEMLTGTPPFNAKESMALLYAHINDPIPQLPDELQRLQPLTEALMAKDPDERVADCDTLVEMIKQVGREGRVPKPRVESYRAAAAPRLKSGVVSMLTWTGIALATTFITAAVIHSLMRPASKNDTEPAQSVAENITSPSSGSKATAPKSPAQSTATATATGQGQTTQRAPVEEIAVATRADTATLPTQERSADKSLTTTEEPVVAPKLTPAKPTSTTTSAQPAVSKPVTTKPKAPSKKTSQRSLAKAQEVEDMLKKATRQLEQDRLSHPPGDNALESYRAILKLDPRNDAAKAGLGRLAQRYQDLAEQKIAENKYHSASLYIDRGLSAAPGHAGLLGVKTKVANAVQAQENFEKAEKYYRGAGGVPKDRKQAVALYKLAADKDHPGAQYGLGVAYANGSGVVLDEDQALQWLRRAANNGNREAQYNLGLGLIFGPKPNPKAAAVWIKKLAKSEYAPAYRVLGWMYTTGTGVEHSIKESIRWVAKGVIHDPIGEPARPRRIISSWQDRFESAYREQVSKVHEEPN